MDAYVINLTSRSDRWNITRPHLIRQGFNPLRFDAINAKTLTEEAISRVTTQKSLAQIKKGIRTEHFHLSRGAVACALSHTELWKKFQHQWTNKYLFVLEDDVHLKIKYQELIKLVNQAPVDWDILLIGWTGNVPGYSRLTSISKEKFGEGNWSRIKEFFGLHAYIINKKAIEKFQGKIFPIEKQLDTLISEILQKSDDIKAYCLNPSKADQSLELNKSDIQTPVYINGKLIKHNHEPLIENFSSLHSNKNSKLIIKGLVGFVIVTVIIVILVLIMVWIGSLSVGLDR